MSSLVGMKRSRPEQEAVSADDDGYTGYLAHLRALISVRTVTSDSDATHRGIEHCRLLFASALEPLGWLVRTDSAGNLQCVPPLSSFDYCQRVLWLCAHIDTVDASASDFGGCDPFVCSESPTHLTGRGANDCKAGVAFMLWYAERMAAGLLPLFNGGFLVTRQEEAGPLARSAPQFALDMASGDLPISSERRGTFVMILENTVSLARTVRQRGMQHRGQQRGQRAVAAAAVAGDATEDGPADEPSEVAVYDRERHSLSLLCTGSLCELGHALLSLQEWHDWKTVAVWPVAAAVAPSGGAGGESCGVGDGGEGGEGGEPMRRVELEEALSATGIDRSYVTEVQQDGGHSCTVRNGAPPH